MRIALFTDTYPPRVNGVATSVLMLKTNLEAMGHDVLVVTSADPNVTQAGEHIIRVPSVPFRTERLAAVMTPALFKDIREFRPDIIHTHSEFSLGIVGRFMAARLKKPHIHTMHTVWEYYTKHIIDIDVLEPVMCQAARKYTALICNRADRVIVPTRKVEDLLRSYRVKKQIAVIPTGIDIERFAPEHCPKEQLREIRSGLNIKKSDKILINICRVEKEKNIDGLLISLKDYLLSRKDVKFVLVGDGTARAWIERLVWQLGLTKKVIFAGKRPREEINRYYRLGDVFVSASVSETQGLTYIEAMASGLPVVAKRDRCLEDVLHEGKNGFMFDDAADMVYAIDKLLSNEELRLRISSYAAACAQNLSSKGYAGNVLRLYKELVKQL